MSGQLSDDGSERISGVCADSYVREAALLASSQNLLGGRRWITWENRERVRRAQRGGVRVGWRHEGGDGVADHRYVQCEFDISDRAELGREPHDLDPRVARLGGKGDRIGQLGVQRPRPSGRGRPSLPTCRGPGRRVV